MTLKEWLKGKREHEGYNLLRTVVKRPIEDCWWDPDSGTGEEYWAVDVLEDGTAITLCYSP